MGAYTCAGGGNMTKHQTCSLIITLQGLTLMLGELGKVRKIDDGFIESLFRYSLEGHNERNRS